VDVTVAEGFWLEYTARGADGIVGLADDLSATGSRPGVVIPPVVSPARMATVYRAARRRGDVIVDPAGYYLDRDGSVRRREWYPWLDEQYGRPQSRSEWVAWMQESIQHQQSSALHGGTGAPSVLVTPCPQLTASDPGELYRVLDAARDVRDALGSSTECWLSINVDRESVREDVPLTRLADAVVDSGAPGVLLRCFQRDLAPVGDRRLIEGLRELVGGCEGADIPVLMPNAGWLGWLALGWGATAYSGGLSKGSWYDRMPTPMNRPLPSDRIFERALLTHVTWQLHEDLARMPGYVPCACASCLAMAGTFDAEESKVHQIRVAHRETDAVVANAGVSVRAGHLRSILDAAIAFRDSLPIVYRERARAGFLDTWRAVL
jgi:hypothetical protein